MTVRKPDQFQEAMLALRQRMGFRAPSQAELSRLPPTPEISADEIAAALEFVASHRRDSNRVSRRSAPAAGIPSLAVTCAGALLLLTGICLVFFGGTNHQQGLIAAWQSNGQAIAQMQRTTIFGAITSSSQVHNLPMDESTLFETVSAWVVDQSSDQNNQHSPSGIVSQVAWARTQDDVLLKKYDDPLKLLQLAMQCRAEDDPRASSLVNISNFGVAKDGIAKDGVPTPFAPEEGEKLYVTITYLHKQPDELDKPSE